MLTQQPRGTKSPLRSKKNLVCPEDDRYSSVCLLYPPVFLVVLNCVVGLQLHTMTFTATDILCKCCFTFSGYNVLMWSQLEEGKTIWKKMYYNYNECPRFVLKGVITQCALLEIGKKGWFFLQQKFSFLAKIGGVFSLQISEKGYIFSVRNEHGNH